MRQPERRRTVSRKGERETAAVAGERPGVHTAGQLLALQRSAGNQAVVGSLGALSRPALQREDEDRVVHQARAMQGQLRHQPVEGLILNATGTPGDVMHCMDAVIYICQRSGVIAPTFAEQLYGQLRAFLADWDRESEEVERLREAVQAEESATAAVAAVEKRITGLNRWTARLFSSKAEREQAREELTTELDDLRAELLAAQRQQNAARVRMDNARTRAMAGFMQPWVRLDDPQAYVYVETDPASGSVNRLGPVPPAGWTVTMTTPGSRVPGLDHMLLSLGNGRAAHLNTAVADQLTHLPFSPGHLNEIALDDYIREYFATARMKWIWTAAPPLWEGEKAEAHKPATAAVV